MQFDIVVIGAGIQGAGVAQAAAAAGYSVLVLEQSGIAAGTSSKSSKLIHGGLRYLESGQLGLVRESLRERTLLLKLAPELVTLQQLHIPVYQASSRSSFTIAAGLSLYKLLSGMAEDTHFRRVPRSAWGDLDGIETRGLRQVFRYGEAQTDDAALTAAVMYSAQQLGAELHMPAQFAAAMIAEDACRVNYHYQGQQRSVTCSVLVNCSGPWSEQVLAKVLPSVPSPEVELVQGAHLLLPPSLMHHYYLEAPQDQRAVFALPWQGRLLVGTTETPYIGEPEAVRCLAAERDYLLQTLGHYFPSLAVDPADIEGFAGLRVLPRTEERAFQRSRDVLFTVDNAAEPRLLSVMGGKLTTYRATALQALERIRSSLPERRVLADTAQLALPPSPDA